VAPKTDPLRTMIGSAEFEPRIRYIRFPHFRNLRDHLQIEFTYPVTALVGPNGTNKTAILRALQGCPDYENVGQYWFSTNLDQIGPDERHRFIHAYMATTVGEVVEVIKTRIARASRTTRPRRTTRKTRVDPDYFEPSRPLVQDGMTRPNPLPSGVTRTADRSETRWTAIRKNVVYLDFRSQLSAFDKYFYHDPLNSRAKSLTSKKLFIRRRSAHLAAALRGRTEHNYYNRERILQASEKLNASQVAAMSAILGRDYESVHVIKHGYFDIEGYSVMLHASNLQYSEAFAGSGEFAVAMLVREITNAPKRSLILLDEPEVSLHPGAQRQLMSFILEQARTGRHQFVISTHSPEIVRSLPSDAIKVFQANPDDGKIDLLAQSSDPTEAFFRLGAPSEITRPIYVEDALAEAIVTRAIRPLGASVYHQLTITKVPGGASAILTGLLAAFVAVQQDCLIFLDGDQRQDLPIDSSTVPEADLQATAERLLGGSPRLFRDGGNDPNKEELKLQQLRRLVDWMVKNVAYLPGDDPESMLLGLAGGDSNVPSSEAKNEWVRRTRIGLGKEEWEDITAPEILGEQKRILAALPSETPELIQISERIEQFVHRK